MVPKEEPRPGRCQLEPGRRIATPITLKVVRDSKITADAKRRRSLELYQAVNPGHPVRSSVPVASVPLALKKGKGSHNDQKDQNSSHGRGPLFEALRAEHSG
jgi:hypothetical protein